jgi:hypothetical protein
MKRANLKANEIITLRDYPVYNEQILKIYFRVFQKGRGKVLPPCPVIPIKAGLPLINSKTTKAKKYNLMLIDFLRSNPKAKYFLIDGSHKTTAAALTHRKLPVIIFEKDEDFKGVKKMLDSGEILGWYKPKPTIKGSLDELANHHFGTNKFMTAGEKAIKMVKERILPEYMVKYFKSKRIKYIT